MIHDLYTIAVKRNHLYLTHGDESQNNFFNETVQAKRDLNNSKITLNDCEKLYKIIHFLVLGEVINL